MRLLAITLVLAASSLLSGLALANTHAPRQYYGPWKQWSGNPGFHVRPLYFKPHKDFTGFKHHLVVFNNRRPNHYYFYNTYTKKYWGRCPTKMDGKPAYEILAEADRKADLNMIPEKAFKKLDKMPPLPETDDDVPLDLPPDDAPVVER